MPQPAPLSEVRENFYRAVCVAGLFARRVLFTLRPLSRADGKSFLPPRLAEYLDFHDWAVSSFAFVLFAFLTPLNRRLLNAIGVLSDAGIVAHRNAFC
jgi:hypothetical protein